MIMHFFAVSRTLVRSFGIDRLHPVKNPDALRKFAAGTKLPPIQIISDYQIDNYIEPRA